MHHLLLEFNILSLSILASDFQSLILTPTIDLAESVSIWLHLLQQFTIVCVNGLENYCLSLIDFLLTVTGPVYEYQVVFNTTLWKQIKLNEEFNQNNYAQKCPPHTVS
jgi:hypothetical protein